MISFVLVAFYIFTQEVNCQPNSGVMFIANLPEMIVGDSLEHICDGNGLGGLSITPNSVEGIWNIFLKKYVLINGIWVEFPYGLDGTRDWEEGDKIVVIALSDVGNNPCLISSGEDYFIGSDYNNNGIDRFICVKLAPMPITYQNQPTAKLQNNQIHIIWSVATQINNEKYIIEHSKDGKNFSLIGKIAGDGTSNETKHHEYIHTSPSIGINYYRIKQVDYDSKYSYSDIASVRYDGNGETSIYPNPVTSEVTITTSEPSSMQIFDVYGRVLSKQEISEGQNTINLSELPSGILIFVVGDRRFKVLKE